MGEEQVRVERQVRVEEQVRVEVEPVWQCMIENSKCTEQGKQFKSAYALKYHYAKHAKTVLIKKLESHWKGFNNPTMTCSECDIIFQSRETLAFHIGAKHGEVDAILVNRGIPVPEDQSAAPAPPAPPAPAATIPAPPTTTPAPPAPEEGAGGEEGVNYSLECQVCEGSVATLSQLHQHCSNHFLRNIQTKV